MAGGFTTVPVRPDTLARLRAYKSGGANYDDVINRLMDREPLEEYLLAELDRASKSTSGAYVDWAALRNAMARR